MNKMRRFLKRSLAFGITFILMCSLLASISLVPASAKKKYPRPGKPVISVKQGESANDVVLTISAGIIFKQGSDL